MKLRQEGCITGLCGNWAVATNYLPRWWEYFSFVGPMSGFKPTFLRQLKLYIPADRYTMVGNDPSLWRKPVSQDKDAAWQAGFHFLTETEFARGAR